MRESAPQSRQRSPPRALPFSPVRPQPGNSPHATVSSRLEPKQIQSAESAQLWGAHARQHAAGVTQHPQHADKAIEAQEWAPNPQGISRGTSVQPWQQRSTAGQPYQSQSNSRQSTGQNGANRANTGVNCSLRPKYLCLPEAESYEAFRQLADAFRHWRRHAEAAQDSRYGFLANCLALLPKMLNGIASPIIHSLMPSALLVVCMAKHS